MNKPLFVISLLLLALVSQVYGQVINISQARQLGAGLAHNQNGDTVTVRGIITTGPELGIIRYLQDPTGGIAAYGSSVNALNLGDSIEIRGVLKNFRMLLELDPVINFSIISSNNVLPAAKVLSLPVAFTEGYESQLVQVIGVTTASTGNFGGNTNYNILQGSSTQQMRVINGTNIVGSPIPSGQFNVTGVMSQYTFTTNPNIGYQLLPRDTNDFSSGQGPVLTSDLQLISHTTNSIEVGFETSTPSSTVWYMGTTNPPTQITIQPTLTTNHTAIFSSLQPATFYYIKGAAISGTDTTFSTLRYFTTVSLSSGNIKALFTKSVNTSLATITPATYSFRGVDDSLINLINSATQTIDLALYNLNNNGISDITNALNNAHARGVRVRLVADGGTAMIGLNALNQQIGRLRSPQGSLYGLMHNKFVLIDTESADPNVPIVWTGSTNLTADQINIDANNVVIIQDQALARAYQIEFEEMFGSNGAQPNTSFAKFGQFKRDNTPKEFTIGGKSVKLYFSPSDDVENNILKAIASANSEIAFATMLITRVNYPNTMIDRNVQAGCFVAGVQNDTANGGTSFNLLRNNPAIGANQMRLYNQTGTLHHKYCLVDYASPLSNPLTITGSHNWSASANDRNDENTLVIDDANIANQFYQEWFDRFTESGGILTRVQTTLNEIRLAIYPNPTQDFLHINAESNLDKMVVTILDIQGRKMPLSDAQSQISNAKQINVSHLPNGVYLLQVQMPNNAPKVIKWVKY